MFLYAGTIIEVRDAEAHISFDDGDSGWVPVSELETIELHSGMEVQCRIQMGNRFGRAVIEQVRGETVDVRFLSGESERTTVAAVRVPRTTSGEGAQATRFASNQLHSRPVEIGARVLAPWESMLLYAGTVDQLVGEEAHIRFDDGDSGWVQLSQVFPLELPPGLRVFGRWKMGAQYYPGELTTVDGNRIHIQYDDGDREWTSVAALRIPCVPNGPNARPTHTFSRGGPNLSWLGWLIPVGIVLLLVFLRGGCD